jgi:hypothetical protein
VAAWPAGSKNGHLGGTLGKNQKETLKTARNPAVLPAFRPIVTLWQQWG